MEHWNRSVRRVWRICRRLLERGSAAHRALAAVAALVALVAVAGPADAHPSGAAAPGQDAAPVLSGYAAATPAPAAAATAPAAGPRAGVVEFLIPVATLAVALAVFDLAALRWGVVSRDGVASAEWRRRQEWSR